MASQLSQWWLDHAKTEAAQTVAKMEEYGSRDLVEIGQQLARIGQHQLTDIKAMEWGCAFYLLGKMARVMSAIERGDSPSDDTWLDIAVYAKMVLAARAEAWDIR